MVRLIALIISIGLQIIAAVISLRFMKLTKYRLSWILLSTAFSFIAVRTLLQLIEFGTNELSVTLSIINDWMGVVISIFIVAGVILIRELFFSLKKAEFDRIRTERRVLHAIIQTEENERKRFAKDLHDGLGPLLSTAKMSLSALDQSVKEEQSRKVLETVQYVVNSAISEIKDISNNLSPHVLSNYGPASALNSFISKINQAGNIQVHFESNMFESRLDSDLEVVIYRTASELVINALKHAEAKHISLSLNKHEKIVTLHCNDDGRGFDMNLLHTDKMKGMGISNIQSRVKSVNGVFILESQTGRGTTALITLNLN